jgi:putative endonuclease
MNNRQKGQLGENLVCKFLTREGYSILARNYLKKWGEIDIVVRKDKKLHFIEVKSTFANYWMPEENVHSLKLGRLHRTISSYFLEKEVDPETEFFIDVASVRIDLKRRKGSIKMIYNVTV